MVAKRKKVELLINESTARRKSGRIGIKRKTITFKMPLSCLVWLRVKSKIFDLSVSEVMQCVIANAASMQYDSTISHQVVALKTAKKKTGKHTALWAATSISALRALDITCAPMYDVSEDELLKAWEEVLSTIQLSEDFEE